MKNILLFPPFYFFSAILLIIALNFLFPQFNNIPFPYNLGGLAVLAFGYHLLSKSSALFTRYETTFQLQEPTAFVQEGFFKYSRNPMYLGALIFLTGLSILTANLVSFIPLLLFFLGINFLCIPPEEALLEQKFGSRYLQYQRQVRRWL